MFVTYVDSAYTRFVRATDHGDVLGAEIAARELPDLNLKDALRLVTLYGSAGHRKFDRAAQRWLVRLLEEQSITLDETRVACEWLALLTGPDADLAAGSLAALVYRT
jgi:hypothetical protein